ncbi:MAG: hypothetical protein ACM30H_08325 [Clostridia bacterium]
MRIDAWCFGCAALVGIQVLAVGALPVPVVSPFGTIFHVLGIAAVTLLGWMATDGKRPTLVVAGAMLLAFFAARGQLEFLAGAAAAAATGGILLFKTRERACAESSQR